MERTIRTGAGWRTKVILGLLICGVALGGFAPDAFADKRKNKRQRNYASRHEPVGAFVPNASHRQSGYRHGHRSNTKVRVNVNVGVGVGVRSRSYCPPPRRRVYCPPPPRVVYCPPTPVYCPPKPVYCPPKPVYCPPPRVRYESTTIVVGAPVQRTTYVTTTATTGGAWSLLESGCYEQALDKFAYEIAAYPTDHEARIGYALAAAFLGDYEVATLAMRRALRADAAALDRVRVSVRLQNDIDQLRGVYRETARRRVADIDSYFMIAALSVLVGDYDEASYAIGRAIESGDCDPSATNLECHIRTRISRSY
ncbi:MAG: hypothetical protein ACF8PN_07015 [Phycisphaerales bacterium]